MQQGSPVPRVGAGKGGRGRTRPGPSWAARPPLCLWRRKSEFASPGTPRPVSGVSEGTTPPRGGPRRLTSSPPLLREELGGPPPTSRSSESGSQGPGRPCGARGACAEVGGPLGPASSPSCPRGTGLLPQPLSHPRGSPPLWPALLPGPSKSPTSTRGSRQPCHQATGSRTFG